MVNGSSRQKGNSRDMIFSIPQIISYVSKFITLKTGDLIFTGTPSGVAAVKEGDILQGYFNKRKLLEIKVG
jgi:2-keto-4-pentenoate hydratase/2-oxohepta-3-ene-1,7-dioic acid hydratase in catechol pathway